MTALTTRPDVGLQQLEQLLRRGDMLVLTGAGISTDSGIPDYRGPSGARRGGQPMRYQEFTDDPDARRRYWARSHVGWRHVARARPNAAHLAVAALQERGAVSHVVTQNVDGLHTRAGSADVVELHGSLGWVVCLGCGDRRPRLELALRLTAVNPGFEEHAARIGPDGDAALPEDAVGAFRTVDCRRCGGVLKPDVVFFGEPVPRARTLDALRRLERSRGLLVLGSSLTVLSGYRFVIRARELGLPVAIVNQGPTKGDRDAFVKLDAPLGEVLPALAR